MVGGRRSSASRSGAAGRRRVGPRRTPGSATRCSPTSCSTRSGRSGGAGCCATSSRRCPPARCPSTSATGSSAGASTRGWTCRPASCWPRPGATSWSTWRWRSRSPAGPWPPRADDTRRRSSTLAEIMACPAAPTRPRPCSASLPSGSSRDRCRREVDLALVLAFGLNRSSDAAERLERLLDEIDDRDWGYVAGQIPLMWLLAGEIHRAREAAEDVAGRRAVVRERPVERRAGADPGAEPPRPAGQRARPGDGRAAPAGGPPGVQRVHGRPDGDGGADGPPVRRRPRPRRGGGPADLRAGHAAGGRAPARRVRAPARPDRPVARFAGPRRAVLPRGGHGAGGRRHDPGQRRRPRPLHPGPRRAVGHAQPAAPQRDVRRGARVPVVRRRGGGGRHLLRPGPGPRSRSAGSWARATSPTPSSPSTRRPVTARRRRPPSCSASCPPTEGRVAPGARRRRRGAGRARRRPAGDDRRPPGGAGLPTARRRADRRGGHGRAVPRAGRTAAARLRTRAQQLASGATGRRPSSCAVGTATV